MGQYRIVISKTYLLKLKSTQDIYKKYICTYLNRRNSNSLTLDLQNQPKLRLCFIKNPTTGLDYKNFDRDAKLVFVQQICIIQNRKWGLVFFYIPFSTSSCILNAYNLVLPMAKAISSTYWYSFLQVKKHSCQFLLPLFGFFKTAGIFLPFDSEEIWNQFSKTYFFKDSESG